MSNDDKKNGIGLGTILFLIFLTLKLAELGRVQYWSWWWVTAPLWIPITGFLVLMLITMIIDYFNENN
jgi:hypothetical protein